MNCKACSTVDEFLAEQILNHRQEILGRRAIELSAALKTVESWVSQHEPELEWIRPDAGGMCCIRLKPSCFDDLAVDRFYRLTHGLRVQIANGEWFGDDRRIIRLGFGYPEQDQLERGLSGLTTALEAAKTPMKY